MIDYKEELACGYQVQLMPRCCAKMFLGGAKNLEAKKEWINELNVFPVPDGDTGTNMTMTIMSAAKEVAALEKIRRWSRCARQFPPVPCAGHRGNSGVILIPASSVVLPRESRNMKRSGCGCSGRCHGKGSGDRIQGSYEAEGRNDSDGCQRHG